MNKVILIGNLSKDIELTTTSSGLSVARFTIAVQRSYANENGEREADFINCVVWRNQAENLYKYCHKGDKIAVTGSIQTRSYDAQDGTKRYVTEVIADHIEFLNTKRNNDEAPAPAEQKQPDPKKEPIPLPEDDELPF